MAVMDLNYGTGKTALTDEDKAAMKAHLDKKYKNDHIIDVEYEDVDCLGVPKLIEEKKE